MRNVPLLLLVAFEWRKRSTNKDIKENVSTYRCARGASMGHLAVLLRDRGNRSTSVVNGCVITDSISSRAINGWERTKGAVG